jgi:hypothetical protein
MSSRKNVISVRLPLGASDLIIGRLDDAFAEISSVATLPSD